MNGEISHAPRTRTLTSVSTTSIDSTRLQASASSSSSRMPLTPPNGAIPKAALTLEDALKASNGNLTQALENVISERNMISSQNAQLWKLIEKQRSGYANVLRELERVRAERDQARGRKSTAPAGGSSGNQSESEAAAPTPRKKSALKQHSSDDGAASSPAKRREKSSTDLPYSTSAEPASDPMTPKSSSHHLHQASSSSLPASSENGFPHELITHPTLPLQLFGDRTGPTADEMTPSPSKTSTNTTATQSYSNPLPNNSLSPPSDNSVRVSTISLPSEAQQYIANMTDSPRHSPNLVTSRTSSPDKASPSAPHGTEERSPPPMAVPHTTRHPGSTDDLPSEFQGVRYKTSEDQFSSASTTMDGDDDRSSFAPSEAVVRKSGTPDELELDPMDSISTRAMNGRYQNPPPYASGGPHLVTNADIAFTRVKVLTSTIRPNERGKDVLSFVISVHPPNKEPWRIEKLYSNVLALDTRVRASLSRSQIKKIANLPDNKLFKDNAPAKVDQRKAVLEHYLQSVAQAPVKKANEICDFFNTDLMNDTRAPVASVGYKEGYLTKRGKNFGGWKTRYFVLQGPILEYYESRGGTHLGSINITGAQIGRQQRTVSRDSEDDSEYRHAFLIIEAKRGQGNQQNNRHVLCADSDVERDGWVDVLVRYVLGQFDDTSLATMSSSATLPQYSSSASRHSTDSGMSMQPSSSSHSAPQTPRRPHRHVSKEEIVRGPVVHISQVPMEVHNHGNHQSHPAMEAVPTNISPVDRGQSGELHRRAVDRAQNSSNGVASEVSLSSSLPSGSNMEAVHQLSAQGSVPRSTSEMGHYSDLPDGQNSSGNLQQPFSRDRSNRQSFVPTLVTVQASPTHPFNNERSGTPDPPHGHHHHRSSSRNRDEQSTKPKISGPMNGVPLPSGYNFGSKEPESHERDRDRKTKSTAFWRFGRDKPAGPVPDAAPSRAVFGVTLQESLAVSENANLPSVLFRCIQYLEAKKAEEEEGIYRLSGSSMVIKNLRERFNQEGDVDLLKADELWDLHAIAGLLKQFLRELPVSILTRELHHHFLSVMDLSNPTERVAELSQIVSQLPVENYSLLRALTAHLILVVQNANLNKMTVRNVGIVFSPTLGIPAGVFSLMLGEFNRVFSVDGDSTESPTDDYLDKPAETDAIKRLSSSSRRNSRTYQESATDQLLGLGGRSLPAEAQSDTDDDLSIQGGSGTETDEGGENDSMPTTESHSPSAGAPSFPENLSPKKEAGTSQEMDSTPVRPGRNARVAGVAASRGLQVATDSQTNKRYSRQLMLPVSPRPPQQQAQQGRSPTRPSVNSSPTTPRI